MSTASIIMLYIVTFLLGFLLGCVFISQRYRKRINSRKEPTLKEIQNTLDYVKENFVTNDKTFDEIHSEFMYENDKCYHCSSTTRMFCIKRPHSEECDGPYDW